MILYLPDMYQKEENRLKILVVSCILMIYIGIFVTWFIPSLYVWNAVFYGVYTLTIILLFHGLTFFAKIVGDMERQNDPDDIFNKMMDSYGEWCSREYDRN